MGIYTKLTEQENPPPAQQDLPRPAIPENLNSGFHEIMNPRKPETLNSRIPAFRESRKPESLNSRKPEFTKAEKYSTQLDPKLKKQVQAYALEHDLKDYEVIEKALIAYFDQHASEIPENLKP